MTALFLSLELPCEATGPAGSAAHWDVFVFVRAPNNLHLPPPPLRRSSPRIRVWFNRNGTKQQLLHEVGMEEPTKIDTNGGDEERGFDAEAAGGAAATNGDKPPPNAAADLQTLAWHVHLCAAPPRGVRALLRSVGVRTGNDHPILTDIAGETRAGQCTAVLGPSGCGKTTLLECIALRRRGFTGSIYVDGAPATPAYLQRMSTCVWLAAGWW